MFTFSTFRSKGWANNRERVRINDSDLKVQTTAVMAAISEDGFDELASCRALAEKRVRALGAKEPAVLRRRLVAFLQRRGFGGSVIGQVLREVLGRQTDDDNE